MTKHWTFTETFFLYTIIKFTESQSINDGKYPSNLDFYRLYFIKYCINIFYPNIFLISRVYFMKFTFCFGNEIRTKKRIKKLINQLVFFLSYAKYISVNTNLLNFAYLSVSSAINPFLFRHASNHLAFINTSKQSIIYFYHIFEEAHKREIVYCA